MIQEVYLPSGELIFRTENKRLMYDDRTVKTMMKNGYKVKMIKINNSCWVNNKIKRLAAGHEKI